MTTLKNGIALHKLAKLLTEQHMTAAQIAAETPCAKPTAYKWLRALPQLGFKVQTVLVRDGSTGPMAVAYAVVPPKKRTFAVAVLKKARQKFLEKNRKAHVREKKARRAKKPDTRGMSPAAAKTVARVRKALAKKGARR